ncbi:MAG TPA: bifunctional DNA primase/polymerase, partial [Sphingomicrobium sp.]|nr:bifunctional DNA primase/polymerase [Sphingomicrobium sp.]
MNKGAYATSGAKLVERGYAAIPIIPGTKRPGELKLGEWVGKSNWREEYTRRLPSRFEMQIWSASDAGVCVVCGPASKYLVGVDIDTDDDAVKSAILSALPPSTIVKRGQKGATYFYRAPMIDKSPSWNLPYADRRLAPDGKLAKYRACDLIGPGRQTLLPPTIHPDTKAPYVWIGPDALEDMNPDELPELLPEHVEAITAALLPFGYNAEPERDPNRPKFEASGRADDFDRPIHRKLNDEAINDFDRWVPHLGLKRCRRTHGGWEAVAEWRASNGGQAFEKRKFNLKFHRSGIVDFGGGPRPYTPLNCVMAALSLRDSDGLDSAFRWLSDAMGWNTAPVVDMPIKGPSRLASVAPEPTEIPVAAYGLSVVEVKGGEPVAEGEGEPQDTATLDALEVLTHCPGLVGEVIDWIVGTARRPNRVMALGVAATVIGTLIGRRVAGPTRSATHLYVACLAPTGSGKQHPLDCLSLLLRSAKAEHLIGPSEFISMPAVINMLTRKPLCLSAQDEFGSFLKRINSRNASGFEQGISKIMRMIWGISFGDYMTPEWAGRAAEPIFAPALSIYGVSTPDEFYRGLQGSELENGFLNRFIVLKTGRTDARVPPLEQGRVPDALAAGLGELFRWGADENSLTTVRVND